MDDRAKAALLREIDRFLALGRKLIPLKPQSKIPLEKSWNKIDYSRRALHAFVNRKGCNIGWRLGPLDVVIDVDPRHANALGSEEQLTEKWGLENLNEVCPTVHTGGLDRGRHYYTKAPAEVKLKTILSDFDGIDFRRHGHYVLIPGCIHPDTGKAYYWDLFSPHQSPEMPDWLYDLLWVDSPTNQLPKPWHRKDYREYIDPDNPTPTPYAPPKTLSLPEIEGHLERIPAEKYQNYDEWLKIGMAIHAACDGDPEGCELFVRWSISDPTYFDATESARVKWASFSRNGQDGSITAATLVAAAMLEGGSPNGLPVERAFDAPVVAAPSLMSLDEFRRLLQRTKKPTLQRAVAQASRYGPEHWDDLRNAIKYAYLVRLAVIDKVKVEYERHVREKVQRRKRAAKSKKSEKDEEIKILDPAIAVVNRLLEDKFEGGKNLIHAKNQQFYEFRKTHWEPVQPNEVDQLIFDAAEAVQLDPGTVAKFRSSTLFSSAERVLVAKTARREDVFRFQGPPPPVVNTRNCEVWISPDGSIEQRPHSPESYLLSCLDTEYDPAATCPVFEKTLKEIFAKNLDPQGMIRHLFEFFGYTMQPHKNIPAWWMFQGDGSNGKTFCFNVFQRLLGSAVLPRAVEDFADSGRNNHALASLVGKLLIMDDDARVDSFLPESALKKLAESKLFEANPKRQHAFTFMSCATPVMLINDWPRVRDLSWGLLRKAYVLPFKRVFAPEEYDLNREPYVIQNELAGILNQSLAGYTRLRTRGKFDEPQECHDAKRQWLQAANPMIEFFNTQIKRTGNGVSIPVTDVYQSYIVWCRNYGGVKFPPAKHRFEISLKQMGFRVADQKGAQAVLGCTLVGSTDDVFT